MEVMGQKKDDEFSMMVEKYEADLKKKETEISSL